MLCKQMLPDTSPMGEADGRKMTVRQENKPQEVEYPRLSPSRRASLSQVAAHPAAGPGERR